jgi:hypothetical protein
VNPLVVKGTIEEGKNAKEDRDAVVCVEELVEVLQESKQVLENCESQSLPLTSNSLAQQIMRFWMAAPT